MEPEAILSMSKGRKTKNYEPGSKHIPTKPAYSGGGGHPGRKYSTVLFSLRIFQKFSLISKRIKFDGSGKETAPPTSSKAKRVESCIVSLLRKCATRLYNRVRHSILLINAKKGKQLFSGTHEFPRGTQHTAHNAIVAQTPDLFFRAVLPTRLGCREECYTFGWTFSSLIYMYSACF